MANKSQPPQSKTRRPEPESGRSWTAWVLSLPRIVRMGIVFLSILLMAFALQQVWGEMALRIVIDSGVLMLGTWLIAGVSLAMYIAGYVYIIGMPGTTPPAGRPQAVYLLLTAILFVTSLGWVIARTAEVLGE